MRTYTTTQQRIYIKEEEDKIRRNFYPMVKEIVNSVNSPTVNYVDNDLNVLFRIPRAMKIIYEFKLNLSDSVDKLFEIYNSWILEELNEYDGILITQRLETIKDIYIKGETYYYDEWLYNFGMC